MKTYQAPWGKTLKIVSLCIVVLAIVWAFTIRILPGLTQTWGIHWLLPAIVIGFLPFMVMGYEVTEDTIYIRRPLWKTRLPLAGLKSATFVPKAMSRALRTCGNAGGFSYTGWYWKRELGAFSAYVTDPGRTVVLRFENRVVVVSPGEPEDFVNALSGSLP